MIIREEQAEDRADVAKVHRLAFGREDEGRLVEALRDGDHARISLVAEDGGRIVGHVLFSALSLAAPDGALDALSLAPVAVVPDRQREGIGSMLIREGLRTCEGRGHRVVVVLGEPGYYRRFGFSTRLAENLSTVYPKEAFMALELVPAALDGVTGKVEYPPPFEAV